MITTKFTFGMDKRWCLY